MRKQGFSLTEALLSLFLSCIVLLILIQMYLVVTTNYHQLQKKVDAIFDKQLLSELLRHHIREAGFTPCINSDYLMIHDKRDKPGIVQAIVFNPEKKTSSIQFSHMSDAFLTVQKRLSSTQLLVDGFPAFNQKAPLMIADCWHGEIQWIKSVQAKKEGVIITLKTPLSFAYRQPFYVGEWVEEHFFMAKVANGKQGLFYGKAQHSERLSDAFTHLSGHWLSKSPPIVEVLLARDNQAPLAVIARVRAP